MLSILLFWNTLGLAAGTAGPSPAGVIRVIAANYSYRLPERAPGGLVTIRLVNLGSEPHYARILRLAEGKTLADVVAWRKRQAPLPEWLTRASGPATTAPGDSTEMTARMEPGTYVLLCTYPTAEGMPHADLGMLAELQLEPAANRPDPRTGTRLQLEDYSFSVPHPIRQGGWTVEIANRGRAVHQVLLVALPEGATAEQELAWFRGGSRGPRPGTPKGGVIELGPGQRVWLRTRLAPGHYLALCAISLEDRGRHFDHGMVLEWSLGQGTDP